uniref:Uncharacterized protein n=1 Tax=Rhizophora mucronata TaxID=61149 RepID=A0A2P2IX16_RHIMU
MACTVPINQIKQPQKVSAQRRPPLWDIFICSATTTFIATVTFSHIICTHS